MKTQQNHLERSIIVLVIFTMVLVGGCSNSSQHQNKPPNVVIISLDTTRPDHIHCYGYDKIRTPVMDKLAADGVLFEQALSVQPVTLPAHSSIFTGQYPYQHGVRDNSTYRLDESAITMAEIFKENGYHTAAFISAFVLHKRFGLAQGFDFYNDTFIKPKQKGRLPVDRRASEVSFLAGEWLRSNNKELLETPFFLWLHYYDPHADYNPPEPYRAAYSNRYDGEIAYTDDWIGYVIDTLKLEGLWDNTIVVIVGDHGESLGEYGENTHGLYIYQPTIRIPLIVHWANRLPAGKRINAPVCSIDIFPTLMDLVGFQGPDDLQGVSLVQAINGRADIPERDLYRETYIPENFNWSHLAGIQGSGNLYIEAPRPELIVLDPTGKSGEDVIGTEFELAGLYQDRLNRMMGKDEGTRSLINLDPDTALKLEALGYFVSPDQEKPDATQSHIRPDPKDRVDLFNQYQAALNFRENGEASTAISIMENLLKTDTENLRVARDLAAIYLETGDYSTARSKLERILELNPDDLEARLDLGSCFRSQGNLDEAIQEFRAVLALNENSFLARFNLALTYLDTLEIDRAENEFLLCQKLLPKDTACLNNLGYIAIKHRNNPMKGIEYLLKAAELEPMNTDILLSLGNAYKNLGKLSEAEETLLKGLQNLPDHQAILTELIEIYSLMGNTQEHNRLMKRLDLINNNETI